MSIERNYISVQCDRCGCHDCYRSEEYAKNVGWTFRLNVPFNESMDLCPECSDSFDTVLKKFVYPDLA